MNDCYLNCKRKTEKCTCDFYASDLYRVWSEDLQEHVDGLSEKEINFKDYTGKVTTSDLKKLNGLDIYYPVSLCEKETGELLHINLSFKDYNHIEEYHTLDKYISNIVFKLESDNEMYKSSIYIYSTKHAHLICKELIKDNPNHKFIRNILEMESLKRLRMKFRKVFVRANEFHDKEYVETIRSYHEAGIIQ